MAHPQPADFGSAAPDAVWWYSQGGRGPEICSASAATVMQAVTRGRAWTDATQAALVALAEGQAAAAPPGAGRNDWLRVAGLLRADAAARQVSTMSLAVGVWDAFHRGLGEPLAAVGWLTGVRPPAWNVPVPGGPLGGVACVPNAEFLGGSGPPLWAVGAGVVGAGALLWWLASRSAA